MELKPEWGEGPDGDKDVLVYINATPLLMSLLYDLDMMPEQHPDRESKAWEQIFTIANHWRERALSEQPSEPCSCCEGSGRLEIGRHIVSHDMASDAGDMQMEGMDFGPEYGPCPECGGTGTARPPSPSQPHEYVDAATGAIEEHAATPPEPPVAERGRALERTKMNADYWLNAAREAEERDSILLCAEQAINAWKNAAYALLRTSPAGMKLVPEWVPVEERLPEDGERVLAVWNTDTQEVTDRWSIQKLMPNGIEDNAAITHWMPLPAAPGGEMSEPTLRGELLKQLHFAASVGLDLSPGDRLCGEAYREIRTLELALARRDALLRRWMKRAAPIFDEDLKLDTERELGQGG